MQDASNTDSSPDSGRPSPSAAIAPGSSEFNELATLLAQFYTTFCTSGMRYWSNLTQLYGDNAEALNKDLIELYKPGLSAEERRQKIEKLRTWLRQSSEMLDRESRLLQGQFAEFDNKLRQLNGEVPNAEAKRFARIKS